MFTKARLLTMVGTLGIVVLCNGADHLRDLRDLRKCHNAINASNVPRFNKFTLLAEVEACVRMGLECTCKYSSAKLESSLVKHENRLQRDQELLVNGQKKSKITKKLLYPATD